MNHFKLYLILLGIIVILLQGCSFVTKEYHFTPQLDDFNGTEYMARANEASAHYFPERHPPTVLLSGDRPELVITSQNYQLTIRSSAKSDRLLTIGPCIIIPLPVIPIVFYKQEFTNNMTLRGNISSFNGQSFSLKNISVSIGSTKYEQLDLLDMKKTYEYSSKPSTSGSSSDKRLKMTRQSITFTAEVPQPPHSIENFEVDLQITEDENRNISFPPLRFYSSSGTVWLVCVM